jgi:hypothetical protein
MHICLIASYATTKAVLGAHTRHVVGVLDNGVEIPLAKANRCFLRSWLLQEVNMALQTKYKPEDMSRGAAIMVGGRLGGEYHILYTCDL